MKRVDEKLQDLVDMALAERFGQAFLAMKEECSVDAEQIAKLITLSEQVEQHPGISEDAKALVQEFLHTDNENNERFQKYLYIQGAKDCVAILRELGVIQ